MPESVIPDVEISTYYLETLAPADAEKCAEHMDALGLYLLDLMAGQGYRVVSGVSYEFPEPVVAQYPDGWVGVRAIVQVQEMDFDVDMDGD